MNRKRVGNSRHFSFDISGEVGSKFIDGTGIDLYGSSEDGKFKSAEIRRKIIIDYEMR